MSETDQEKLDYIIVFLTERHLDLYGGYPLDWAWIGNTLVVADLDDGKDRNRTELRQYERDKLIAWYDAARKLADGDDDMTDALYETAGDFS